MKNNSKNRHTTKIHLNCPQQRAIASIGQRRNDETRRVTEILVTIVKHGIDHPNFNGFLFPIIPQLDLGWDECQIMRII